jgi:hypothetical protein
MIKAKQKKKPVEEGDKPKTEKVKEKVIYGDPDALFDRFAGPK